MEMKSETMSVRELLELRKHNMLRVNHEYQRAAVWSDSQQKKLIDSVMRGYPLPLIYLHHRVVEVAGMKNEGLEIIDGQQRINALFDYGEGALKLFDPVKDDKKAKFPTFIKSSPCPWAGLNFLGLPDNLKERFLGTQIAIVKVTTDVEDEARDLFIRLQAGLPLNAQEKRDAWPGGFTELVLKFGGKREIKRYPGHDFFCRFVKKNTTDRGAVRQLCAQICMLFFERATQGGWMDIGTQQVDEYYYQNLGFDIAAPRVARLSKVLDLAVQLFSAQTAPKLQGHEAIHVVLLLDSLLDDYTKSWQSDFMPAYDSFKEKTALAKKRGEGEYWTEYGSLTQTQSAQARTIQRRHTFFVKEMFALMKPTLLDASRIFGEVERQIVYYRYSKKCAVCGGEIMWDDLEIHHIEEHQVGGQTVVENAVPVHRDHHPKGQKAIEFQNEWWAKKHQMSKGAPTLAEINPGATTAATSGASQTSVTPIATTKLSTKLPPDGTKCRFTYLSTEYVATIVGGRISISGLSDTYGSFSAASGALTNTSRNGLRDWQIQVPGSNDWLLAFDWREKGKEA